MLCDLKCYKFSTEVSFKQSNDYINLLLRKVTRIVCYVIDLIFHLVNEISEALVCRVYASSIRI